jgi:AraC-like DNA-binding protein
MTVRASTLLASIVLNTGASAEELARVSGISVDAILSPTFLPYEEGIRLWEAAELITGDPAVGLRGGSRVTLDQLGVVMTVFVHALNVRDALERLARLLPLVIRPATVELHDEPSGAAFRYGSPSQVRHGVDAMLSAVVSVLRQCTGRALVPTRVGFQAPPPPSAAPYEACFGVRPSWSQPISELAFAHEDLAAPMRGAEPELARLLEQHAQNMLGPAPRPFDDRLRAAIVACASERDPSIEAVAKKLGTSTRSLQRRLAEASTTFSAARDAALRERAEELLTRDDASIEVIAERLGFASRTSFERAFRRWTGRSPASVRRG